MECAAHTGVGPTGGKMGELKTLNGAERARDHAREIGPVELPAAGRRPVAVPDAGPGRAPSRRYSVRRRLLAVADVLSLVAADGLVWAIPPPASIHFSDRLWLAAVLPIWVLLNKLLGLYDRDDNVIHH